MVRSEPNREGVGRGCAAMTICSVLVLDVDPPGVERRPAALTSYDRRMSDQEARGISILKRVVTAGAVLIGDFALLLVAGWVIENAHLKGKLCDGATVWCDGGDPTPAEALAEDNFRSAVAYTSWLIAALIMLVIAVVAWRHRRREIVLLQTFPLLLVAALVSDWTPDPSV
jgi:hypothetical protein